MKSQRVVFGDTLVELGREDGRIVVLDADLANSTMTVAFDRAFPDRFYQMGIAEQNMVGVAAGMAQTGLIPWLCTFVAFLSNRALDQIRMAVLQTRANVKIAGAYSGLLTGMTGKSHQDISDLAVFRVLPGLTVLAPVDDVECRAMMAWATQHEGPVYLRLARDPAPTVLPEDYSFAPGKPVVLRQGKEVALVSTGVESARVCEAANCLGRSGIDAAVIHLGSLKPLDEEAFVEAVGPAGLVVTVEEHSEIGGLGGLVAEVLSARSPRRVVRIGIRDEFGESAPNEYLLDHHGLSSDRVAARVLVEVSRHSGSRL
jgi:transketolase